MPLTFFRIGWFAWSKRRTIGRGILAMASMVLMVPILLGLLVTTAAANLPLPAGSPARPMATFRVSQMFGCTGFVLEPRRGDCAHFHSGVDLVGPAGGAVYSVLPGLVEVQPPSGYGGGYGVHVIIRHDPATLTMYAHLLTATVVSGQSVVAGALIGYEGSTGLSTGPHLHFEVHRAGVPIDPTIFFPAFFGGSGSTSSSSPAGVSPRPN
jgi:murein DD-endopeptidase MepM/ murein hydrolase activator NlpD